MDFFRLKAFLILLDTSLPQRQGSTIIMKMLYMIIYMYQKFGICDIHWQIPENIYKTSYLLPTDFPNNFSSAHFYLKRKENC